MQGQGWLWEKTSQNSCVNAHHAFAVFQPHVRGLCLTEIEPCHHSVVITIRPVSLDLKTGMVSCEVNPIWGLAYIHILQSCHGPDLFLLFLELQLYLSADVSPSVVGVAQVFVHLSEFLE